MIFYVIRLNEAHSDTLLYVFDVLLKVQRAVQLIL